MIDNDQELSMDQRKALKMDLHKAGVETERGSTQNRDSVTPSKNRNVNKSKIELP